MKHHRILFWSITVALGGFLFGFDTAVISGAEQDIQKIWGLNSVQHGFTVSIALIGTVIGALFGGIPIVVASYESPQLPGTHADLVRTGIGG